MTVHIRNFVFRNEQININFEINFQYERGLNTFVANDNNLNNSQFGCSVYSEKLLSITSKDLANPLIKPDEQNISTTLLFTETLV